MRKETEFDFFRFVRMLSQMDIPYLVIGRWAVILHGAPLLTADYDFWIEPASKEKLLRALEPRGYELPDRSRWKRPILAVFAGAEKIDLFFFRRITNSEGQTLTFDDCRGRADIKYDFERHISIPVPAIDDLILLKKIPRSSPEEENKDRADIRFLEKLKKKKHS
jgi:hypothetical protein